MTIFQFSQEKKKTGVGGYDFPDNKYTIQDCPQLNRSSYTLREMFNHVRPLELVAQFPVVMASAHTRDDSHLRRSVLSAGDVLGLLHQKCPVALQMTRFKMTTKTRRKHRIDESFTFPSFFAGSHLQALKRGPPPLYAAVHLISRPGLKKLRYGLPDAAACQHHAHEQEQQFHKHEARER